MAITKDLGAVYELTYNPNYIPTKSPDSHIDKLVVDGEPTFILTKESAADYYDVDGTTNAIWQLMDGNRTVKQIYEEAKKSDTSLTEKQVKDVIVSLAEEGIIASTEGEVRSKRVHLTSAFELDVNLLMDSSKSLAGFFRVTRKLIKKQELPIALAISAIGFLLFYGNFLRIFANPSLFNLAGSAVVGWFFYQIFILLPVYAVHELAHGAVCDYYGGKPRGIGTGLYYLAPFFYCDNSDAWRLSRRARIMIAAAGPISTLVISSFLVFWSYFVPPGYYQNLLQIGAFFGFYGSLINFSPVLETDGYYILAESLNIPNLRDETFSFAKRGLLKAFGRPVKAVRQSVRRRNIIALYTVITVLWSAFFGYTSVWLFYVYGNAAYNSVAGLGATILGTKSFNLTGVGVDVGTLSYFALYVTGFAVMGVVASKNIRMKGVKLETIHDKRVSAFLPLPASMGRADAGKLVNEARKSARKVSRSFSVTLELPLCVAAIKLGEMNQSLDAMRGEMQRVEQTFRTIHSRFLTTSHRSDGWSSTRRTMSENLVTLAQQFPYFEKRSASSSVSQFIHRQDEVVGQIMQSAFGTVWTLELSPSDYKRIRREMLSSLIADDLGVTDLPGELENFKKRTVLGVGAIADLSSEIEAESREVYKKSEVYQSTVFLEPMKSRLVFVGRTDSIEGSVVWLGGMFLYQAWTSYVREALNEAALGLKSIRLAPSPSLARPSLAKLSQEELPLLEQDLARMETLEKLVQDGLVRAENTMESAANFHETLESLVSDQTFDVGLYNPIIAANGKYLKDVKEQIDGFREEFEKVSKKMQTALEAVKEEHARRSAEGPPVPGSWTGRLIEKIPLAKRIRGPSLVHSPLFDAEVKLMFATSRLVYPVVIASDIVV